MNKLTKRILSTLMAGLMLVGAIPGITLPATTVNAEDTVVTKVSTGKIYDFEADTVGKMPENFTATNHKKDQTTIQVSEEGNGNKALYINNISGKPTISMPFTSQKGTFTIGFRVKYVSDSATTQSTVTLTDGSNQTFTLLEQKGLIKNHNGTAWVTLMDSYERNVWYTVSAVINVANGTYDMSIQPEGGETKSLTNFPFRAQNVSEINTFSITLAGNTVAEMYLDDIYVPTVSSTPETPDEPEKTDAPEDPTPTEGEVQLEMDFEDGTVGDKPANSEISYPKDKMDSDDKVVISADPKNPDNKVLEMMRTDIKYATLIKIPQQNGTFAVEYRIMFSGYAQCGALVQQGTAEKDNQGAYLLIRPSKTNAETTPQSLEYISGSNWNVMFGNSEFKQDEWYTVKLEVNAQSKTYEVSVTDASGTTKTAAEAGFRNPVTALDYLNFNFAGGVPGTMYVDDIKVVSYNSAAPDQPVDPEPDEPDTPVNPNPPVDPDAPVVPDAPSTPGLSGDGFDFEGDKVGSKPQYVELDLSGSSSVKVSNDPDTSVMGNKVIMLTDNDKGSAKANMYFEAQKGTFTVTLRIYVDTTGQYNVNLYGSNGQMGPRFMLRNGNLEYMNGAWTVGGTHKVNTWYNIKIVSNVETKTYSVYVNEMEIAKDAAFATNSMTDLNMIAVTTAGGTIGKLYADDIAVPNPIKIESATPPGTLEKYVPSYLVEQILSDGFPDNYMAFPSILKLSDEKVIIAYKATTAHMDVEADLDIIVFNPKTKKVISKTTIDGTVGEAAQNPEIMQMPNGDLVIYTDIQRVSKEGQQRYGVKEMRSTDGGNTWKVRALDGTYKNVKDVPIHEYMVLTDDQGIVYGYTFDDITVNGVVYMLAMSFPEFGSNPGRSVHVIKTEDNGESWIHVKNLTTAFNLAFNESSIEAYKDGFIVNCRLDGNGKKSVSVRTDAEFNKVASYDYADKTDIILTTHRPKLFTENGKYYLLGRNVIDGATTLCLYEIDPVSLAPLNYIELKNLPGYGAGSSFYAEYYLQEENGVTYFNVITYVDTKTKNKPDIVRYEFLWEEILYQEPVSPKMPENAVKIENKTDNSADVVFQAATDDRFIKKYTIYVNNELVGTLDFGEITEVTGNLPGAKTNYSGQGSFYIAMPSNIPAGVKLPVVIAVHGSGRDALDYRDTDFYAEQKNIALANGYIFAAISNERDTWGLDDGLYNLNLFYDYLIANYPIQEKAALWATSAGGTLANRMVKDYPEKVSFVLGTFPVYDLISGFNVNSCKTAWGTTDLATFKTKILGKNPIEFADALKNHDYYIAHGSADTAVPIADHSQRLLSEVGDNIHLQVIEGGVHGTSNYDFYGDVIKQAFAEHPVVYTYHLTGLATGTNYRVYVEASDEDGYTAASESVFFRLSESDGTPDDPNTPGEPGNPGASDNKGIHPGAVAAIVAAGVAVCGAGAFVFIKKKKK